MIVLTGMVIGGGEGVLSFHAPTGDFSVKVSEEVAEFLAVKASMGKCSPTGVRSFSFEDGPEEMPPEADECQGLAGLAPKSATERAADWLSIYRVVLGELEKAKVGGLANLLTHEFKAAEIARDLLCAGR